MTLKDTQLQLAQEAFSKKPTQLAQYENVEALNPMDISNARMTLRAIRRAQEQVEEQRTSITKPLLEAKRAVDKQAKPLKEYLTQLEDHLKHLLEQYATRLVEQGLAGPSERVKQLKAAGADQLADAMEQRAEQRAYEAVEDEVGGDTRVQKLYRVTNLADFAAAVGAGLVPESCLKVQQAELNKYMRKHGVAPGVEVTRKVVFK